MNLDIRMLATETARVQTQIVVTNPFGLGKSLNIMRRGVGKRFVYSEGGGQKLFFAPHRLSINFKNFPWKTV